MMKLIDTISVYNIFEAFKNIFEDGYIKFNWFDTDKISDYKTVYYYGRSGLKEISIYYNMLSVRYDGDILNIYKNLAKILYNRFNDKWNRLFDAMVMEYNPIENYNMTEKSTRDEENSGETSLQQEIESKQTENNYGFNSISSQPVGEISSKTTADPTSNKTISTISNKESNTLSRSGNIGVTTTQQMLEQEIEIRKNIFMDIVYSDIDSVLASPLY